MKALIWAKKRQIFCIGHRFAGEKKTESDGYGI